MNEIILSLIILLSCEYSVPENFVKAIVKIESDYTCTAIHQNKNGTTDYGLMQLNSSWFNDENWADPIEVVIANRALQVSGLDWNLFIKDYVIRELRKDLMKIDGIAEGLQLMQYVPFLTLGMFNTCAILLSQETFTNETLEAIRLKWIPLLVSANDIDDEVYEDRLTNLST